MYFNSPEEDIETPNTDEKEKKEVSSSMKVIFSQYISSILHKGHS